MGSHSTYKSSDDPPSSVAISCEVLRDDVAGEAATGGAPALTVGQAWGVSCQDAHIYVPRKDPSFVHGWCYQFWTISVMKLFLFFNSFSVSLFGVRMDSWEHDVKQAMIFSLAPCWYTLVCPHPSNSHQQDFLHVCLEESL